MHLLLTLLVAGVELALAQNCPSLELVYARATGEPAAAKRGWSQGYGAAGKSLLGNVTALIPGSSGYAVNYPASLGTENQGAADMIKHLNEKVKACPQTVYALGGHSQGGFAVVNAAPKMSKEVLNRIVAVTMFGSPACPEALKNRCISYCATGDTVCSKRAASNPGPARFFMAEEEVSEEELWSRIEARQVPKGRGKGSVGGGGSGASNGNCAAALGIKTTGGAQGGHMGYNADGTYVKAAACFIKSRFDKRVGGGGA